MKALSLTTVSLAVLGLSLVAGSNGATAASQKQAASNQYECFTDDGYGRKRPCSAGYMQKSASGTYECFTDDGYGRKLPCSFRIKR